MIPLPSPRQLRYLVALAEHGNFGRAAMACAVTQSTLSAGIQELETLLGGVLLVERSKRHVLVTALGRDIVRRARRILRESEDLVDAASIARRPLAGPLRLGVIPTIGPYLLPRLMPAIRTAHPELQLYVREEQTAGVTEKLSAGTLDLVMLALPHPLPDAIETLRLGEDELLLACPATHPLAAADQVRPEDLQQEPLLLLEDGHCLRSQAIAACDLVEAYRNEVFQGTSLRTLVQMVAAELGVTLLPRMALATELSALLGAGKAPLIAVRPLSPIRHARTVALAWRRSSGRKAEFQLLARLITPLLDPAE